jgi:hypothetical protein
MRSWLILLAIWSIGAHAVLGEKAGSLTSEATTLKVAKRAGAQTSKYSIVEMQLPNSLVREYVAPSGDIIAVSWKGTHPPHLKLILGKYYQHFQNAVQNRGRLQRRAPFTISNSEITMVSIGRPHHFSGKAILPNAYGLQLGDIQ